VEEVKKALKLKTLLLLNVTDAKLEDIELADSVVANVYVQQITSALYAPLNKAVQFLPSVKTFHFSAVGVMNKLLQCAHTKRFKYPMLAMDVTEDLPTLVADYAPLVADSEIYFVVHVAHMRDLEELLEEQSIAVETVYSVSEDAEDLAIVKFTNK